MSETLKPCPFCGREPVKLTSDDGFTSIGCLHCNPLWGVMVQAVEEAEAVDMWNTRPDDHREARGAHCPYAQPTDLTDGCAAMEKLDLMTERYSEAIKAAALGDRAVFSPELHDKLIERIGELRAERTCRDVSKTFGRWACSECGRSMSVALTDEPPGFCPSCGAKVVSE